MSTLVGSYAPDDPTPATPDAPQYATPQQTWHAVDQLTNPTTVRLTRDDHTTEHITLPSLFEQLVDAVESGAGGLAHGVQESKPPLDAAALALLIEIADAVRSGCWNWHLKRSFDTPKDLRKVVSAVIRHDQPREIDILHGQITRWATRIRATISSDPDRTWRMHGAACRVCASTSIPVYGPDGSETRQPALSVHSDDGRIDWVECGFCGSRLTGDDLTAIVLDTLNANARKLA